MKRTPIISLLLILAGSSMSTASEIVVPTRSPGAVHLTAHHPAATTGAATWSPVTHVPSSTAFPTTALTSGAYGMPMMNTMWAGGIPGLAGLPLGGALPRTFPAPITPMMPMAPMAGMISGVEPVIPTELPPLTGLPLLATAPVVGMPIPMQSTSIMAQTMGVWSGTAPGGSDLQATSMFAVQPVEPRLFHVHDLVQIIVRESSVAASFQGLETEKDYELAGGVEAFPGVNKFDPLTYTEFDVVGEKDFEGEGEYVREDELVTRLTAEVIDMRPNGNLVLEARTRIRTDGEEWYTQLTGICRPIDITAANTILSNQIFDLKIEKRHKGEVPKAASKGLLAQALDAIFAF